MLILMFEKKNIYYSLHHEYLDFFFEIISTIF